MKKPTSKTWTKERFLKLMDEKKLEVVQDIPDFIFNTDKILVRCNVCKNDKNRLQDGPYLFSLQNIKSGGCSRCEGSQRRTVQEILQLAENNNVRIIEDLPADYNSGTKVHLECLICGNSNGRDVRKLWTVQIECLYQNRAGCPKCSKVQSISEKELCDYLRAKELRFDDNKNSKNSISAKTPINLICNICDVTFSTCIDRLKSNVRNCGCNKPAWHHFENLVREVYQGSPHRFGRKIADCVLVDKKIIIEAKFGPVSMTDNRRKGAVENQQKFYTQTGYRVFYVINCPQSKIGDFVRVPGIKYLFLEDLKSIPINGITFSEDQFLKAADMLENPWKYSTRIEPQDYDILRLNLENLVTKNNGVLPTTNIMQQKLGVSYQKIIDAYGLGNFKGDVLDELCKIISGKIGVHCISNDAHRLNQCMLKLKDFIYKNYQGEVLSPVYEASGVMTFKCKIDDHPPFPLRSDKVLYDRRWCPLCRKNNNVLSND